MTADSPEPEAPATQLVEVDCPLCGNLNRGARRACKRRRHGGCGGRGRVLKRVPTAEAEARHLVDQAWRDAEAQADG